MAPECRTNKLNTAWLCLGSNLGNREESIATAIHCLSQNPQIEITRQSDLYETEPEGYKDQPWFVNAAVEIQTTLPPRDLLAACLQIETGIGRIRDPQNRYGPRIIDIDIALYDDIVMNTPDLTIPHPELQNRKFMLLPLLEIDPNISHPVLNRTVKALYTALPENKMPVSF